MAERYSWQMPLDSQLKSIAMVTREWPPEVYGGAGVHVINLVDSLKKFSDVRVDVNCFGSARGDANAYELDPPFNNLNVALKTLLLDMDIARNLGNFDLVHTHTWYANFAGYLASKLFDVPHVVTSHSLEPLRPWKADQLAGGYEISSWIEKSSYESAQKIISVSDAVRADILKVYPKISQDRIVTIRNGIDTNVFRPIENNEVIERFGIKNKFAIFVGRITRQKGLIHLLRSWREIPKDFALVIAATSADEPQIFNEVKILIQELQNERNNVVWIKDMLSQDDLISLLTHAELFVCPSVYEPLGIVNLEAMACETAVVASAVGGIPEVVKDGETGILISHSKIDEDFEESLREGILKVMSDSNLAKSLGKNGRIRAISEFGWDKVAAQTLNLYRSL
ncbi:MAG: glycogen synthase [Candidatus Nanopelagicaceae bacterium]